MCLIFLFYASTCLWVELAKIASQSADVEYPRCSDERQSLTSVQRSVNQRFSTLAARRMEDKLLGSALEVRGLWDHRHTPIHQLLIQQSIYICIKYSSWVSVCNLMVSSGFVHINHLGHNYFPTIISKAILIWHT